MLKNWPNEKLFILCTNYRKFSFTFTNDRQSRTAQNHPNVALGGARDGNLIKIYGLQTNQQIDKHRTDKWNNKIEIQTLTLRQYCQFLLTMFNPKKKFIINCHIFTIDAPFRVLKLCTFSAKLFRIKRRHRT